MKRTCILLFALLAGITAVGQTHKIAVLRQAVLAEAQPAKRFDVLWQLLEEHESIRKDSLAAFTAEINKLARDLNEKPALIKAGMAQVNLFLRQDRLEAATHLTDSLLSLVDSSRNEEQELFVKLSLQRVNCYAAGSRYQAAVDILYRLLPLTESLKDSFSQAQCMNALGVIDYNLDKLDDEKKWCNRLLSLCGNEPRFDKVRTYTYINLSALYSWVGQFDSARYYIDMAFPLCKKIENLYYLANAYMVEADLYKWSGEPAKAESPMLKAIAIREQTEGNIIFSNEQLALGNMYLNIKQYEKAAAIYNHGIRYAIDSLRAKGTPINYDILLQYYKGLAKTYKLTARHELYATALEKIMEVQDSLNKLNSETAMAEMQTKYNVQLKDNTIIRQKLDITQKNVLLYGSLLLLALSAVIAWLLFRNYSRRQKMKLYLVQAAEKQKAEWAVKEAEEKERKRIAADLHDNMGSYAAGIKANVEELMTKTETHTSVMEHLRSNSQQMVALLGDTIWALKKEALSLSAISDRLKLFVQRLRASHPQISFTVKEQIAYDPKLPPIQAYHLFMAVQEAVNNAVRHSGGTEIVIGIISDADWHISITDNGTGMNGANPSPEGGNGCYNMRMRAEESGWSVIWEQAQPHGTCVIVSNIN